MDLRNFPTSPPRGLRKEAAANYCGVKVSKFEKLVRANRLPGPLPWGIPHVWDRGALDSAIDMLTNSSLKSKKGRKHA